MGGELQLCEVGETLQKRLSIKHKHYMLHELTMLTGDLVMYVVIFVEQIRNNLWEAGLDLEIDAVGDTEDFLTTKANRFSMGPTYKF